MLLFRSLYTEFDGNPFLSSHSLNLHHISSMEDIKPTCTQSGTGHLREHASPEISIIIVYNRELLDYPRPTSSIWWLFLKEMGNR